MDKLLTIREFQPEADYPMVSAWWTAHEWPAVPAAILPRLGLICQVNGMDAAAAWLYMDNSVGVCMLEWIVTNPALGGKDTIRAIGELTRFFKERALEMDYGVMMTTCKQPALARLLERNGFARTDESMIHLVGILRS